MIYLFKNKLIQKLFIYPSIYSIYLQTDWFESCLWSQWYIYFTNKLILKSCSSFYLDRCSVIFYLQTNWYESCSSLPLSHPVCQSVVIFIFTNKLIRNRPWDILGPIFQNWGPRVGVGGSTPIDSCSHKCFLHFCLLLHAKILCCSHFIWFNIFIWHKSGPNFGVPGARSRISAKLTMSIIFFLITIMSRTFYFLHNVKILNSSGDN